MDLSGHSIGVFELEGSGASSASGVLHNRMARLDSSDVLEAVDRSKMKEVMRELKLRNEEELVDISAQKLADEASRLRVADYLLVGSVTNYQSTQETIPIKAVPVEGEMERYRAEHASFRKEVNAKLQEASSPMELLKPALKTQRDSALREHLAAIQTPQQWESVIRSNSVEEYVNLAKVALNARLIEVSTSKQVWSFRGEVSGQSLTQAMEELVSDLVEELVRGTAPETALQPASDGPQEPVAAP